MFRKEIGYMNSTENNNKDEYTVEELLQMLAEDDSWEEDPEYRMKAIGTLKGNVFIHC